MVTVTRAEPKSNSKYDAAVFTRVTAKQAQRLAEVQAMEPALPSRADAVRRLIDSLEDDDLDRADAAEGKEALAGDAAEGKEALAGDAAEGKEALAGDDVAAIVAALQERTRAYNELIKQVHAIGVNVNQLTRLGHQMNLGAPGTIPTAAVEGTGRALKEVKDRASVLAHQDAYVESVVVACLRR